MPPKRLKSLITGVLPALLVLGLLFGGGLIEAFRGALVDKPFAFLEHPDFWPGFKLTLAITLTTTLLSLCLALALALFIRSLPETKLAKVTRTIAQSPLPLPHLVIALSMVMFLSPLGLLNRLLAFVHLGSLEDPLLPLMVNDAYGLGIIATYVFKEAPFVMMLILSSLRGETRVLENAAQNLGANALYTLRTVTLPALWVPLRTGALLVFAYTFGAFDVPLLLGRTRPQMLGVLSYKFYTDGDLSMRSNAMGSALFILFFSIAFFAGASLVTRALSSFRNQKTLEATR